MGERPTISVCIPTYNRAPLLRPAIESVLAQSCGDFELIVYDDASTDDTEELVRSFTDDRLRYFQQPTRVNIAEMRNLCLAEARGRYLAWLDSDDLYQPRMLELQSARLDEDPSVGLVHGAFEVIDAAGRPLPAWPRPFATNTVERSPEAFAELLLANFIQAPTVMVRHEAYQRVGEYSQVLGNYGEDWEMWLRIARHYDVAYTAESVAFYRWHPASATGAATRRRHESQTEWQVIRRVLAQEGESTPESRDNRRRAKRALATKALQRAGEALLRGEIPTAHDEWAHATRAAPRMGDSQRGRRVVGAIEQRDEAGFYRESTALLRKLVAPLGETRFGQSLRKQIERDPDWDRELRVIAAIVRQCVPVEGQVALVDKWDPTLRTLCERRGWHFPDLQLHSAGYPADSAGAIAHLQELMNLGAGYLVFPSAAFWWLDHYQQFRRYLEEQHHRVWDGQECIVFELAPRDGLS